MSADPDTGFLVATRTRGPESTDADGNVIVDDGNIIVDLSDEAMCLLRTPTEPAVSWTG